MPLGNQGFPRLDGTTQVVPVAPQQLAPAAPDLAERQAGGEIWDHKTLVDADFSNGIAVVTFAGDVTAIEVQAPAGVPIWIGLDRPGTTSSPGSYDIAHPGSGLLSSRTRPVRQIYISTGTGTAPGAPVEVYGYGGSYAIGIGS